MVVARACSTMMLTSSSDSLDYDTLQHAFKTALDRRDSGGALDLPTWLVQPADD